MGRQAGARQRRRMPSTHVAPGRQPAQATSTATPSSPGTGMGLNTTGMAAEAVTRGRKVAAVKQDVAAVGAHHPARKVCRGGGHHRTSAGRRGVWEQHAQRRAAPRARRPIRSRPPGGAPTLLQLLEVGRQQAVQLIHQWLHGHEPLPRPAVAAAAARWACPWANSATICRHGGACGAAVCGGVPCTYAGLQRGLAPAARACCAGCCCCRRLGRAGLSSNHPSTTRHCAQQHPPRAASSRRRTSSRSARPALVPMIAVDGQAHVLHCRGQGGDGVSRGARDRSGLR